MDIDDYFKELKKKTLEAYEIARKARSKCLDPEPDIEIPISEDMADRVQNILSIVDPIILEINLPKAIREIEREYGPLQLSTILKISEYTAKEVYKRTKDKVKSIDLGLRAGFAYHTLGVVAAPTEGIVKVIAKKRRDGKEYIAVYYAGPVRSAGGTPASFSVVIADYLRRKFGFETWDPSEEEIQRYIIEIYDYKRVKSLQYTPKKEELEFLLKHLPIEVTGEPTEDAEVSAYKDLPRIETNRIRGGMALVIAEGLAQKAKKLAKKFVKKGIADKFGMSDWKWIVELKELQERLYTSSQEDEDKNEEGESPITPSWKYLSQITAGRPVISLPMQKGGFRLRYGKSRTNGHKAVSIHPATAVLTLGFLAWGAQMVPERPGKGAGTTFSDTLEPPVVRLKDGSVIIVRSEKLAKKLIEKNLLDKVLFLGDFLVTYGDFLDTGHILAPVGYCEEWWILEFEKAAHEKLPEFEVKFDMHKPRLFFEIKGLEKLSKFLDIVPDKLERIIRNPLRSKPTFLEALKISVKLGVPLHPKYTFYWKNVSFDDVIQLISFLKDSAKFESTKIKIDKEYQIVKKIIIPLDKIEDGTKRIMEEIYLPHKVKNGFIIIKYPYSAALMIQLGYLEKLPEKRNNDKNGLDAVQKISIVRIRDKVGIYIGVRMGRPEKAKIREMRGSPMMLFPVGLEGGRMRNFMEALHVGKIKAETSIYYCKKCKRYVPYPNCIFCGSKTIKMYKCQVCGAFVKTKEHCGKPAKPYTTLSLNVKEYIEAALKNLGLDASQLPKLIKGPKGLTSKEKLPERLEKGILRARYNIFVFRDGTVRFDAIEIPITYFKPKDLVYVSIEKLKELGYTHDIYGNPLESEDQILELKPQDVILPTIGPTKKGGKIMKDGVIISLLNTAKFVDELLQRFYKLSPYYNAKKPEDLIGHLVIVMAPHTSAGTVGRIIGFSRTQTLLMHPLMHASIRRNCFYKDTYIYLFKDGKVLFDKIEAVIERILKDKEYKKIENKDGTMIIYPKDKYYTIGYDPLSKKLIKKEIKMCIKKKHCKWVRLRTVSGKEVILTNDHPVTVLREGRWVITVAEDLKPGDMITSLKNVDIISEFIKEKIEEVHLCEFLKNLDLEENDSYVWLRSEPEHKVKKEIRIDEKLMWLFGLYIMEGYIYEDKTTYQIVIRNLEQKIQEKVRNIVKEVFGVDINIDDEGRIIISSKIVVELFKRLGFGKKLEEKDIPDWIFNLDRKKIASFIAGVVDGGSSVDYNVQACTIYSANYKLINKISLILKKFGILECHLSKRKGLPDGIVYRISMYNRHLYDLINNIYPYLVNNKNREKSRKSLDNGKFKPEKRIIEDKDVFLESIENLELFEKDDNAYSLEVDGNGFDNTIFVQQNMIVHNCDGDEGGFMLLMDALLNFSKHYLPAKRGGTMDAPLTITIKAKPMEVDDEVHSFDTVWNYPLELYESALQYKDPGEVNIEVLGSRIGKGNEYTGWGFMHDIESISKVGNKISSYKRFKSMLEKLSYQLKVAELVEACDPAVVAGLVINLHFARDVRGNLRKFSSQEFRCVKCNEKYRRIPLSGKCEKCGGRLVFTVHYGTVTKYLGPSLWLAERLNLDEYTKSALRILKLRVDQTFGKQTKEKSITEFFN